jgi:hypothetical protein
LEDVLRIYAESIQADQNAEVLCMPILSGKASAIANDTGVTWGMGHSGATSGTGPLFEIPCQEPHFTKSLCIWHEWAKADLPEGAYVELVEDKGKVFVVQVRGGPSVVGARTRYVPHPDYKVTDVIYGEPDDPDMLAWEKRIRDAVPGTLISLPGSSLAGHMAVHGIARGLAVDCSGEVVESGSVIQPESGTPAPLTRLDCARLGKWVRHFETLPLAMSAGDIDRGASYGLYGEQLALSTATLHASPHWGNEDHLLKLRAHGAVVMAKFIAAACLGEARHFNRHGPGTDGAHSAIKWGEFQSKANRVQPPAGRATIFACALRKSLVELIPYMEGAVRDFGGRWGGKRTRRGSDASTGYGGPKWRRSAKIGLALLKALVAFERRPNLERWLAVLTEYNLAVNAAHNGGKLLDKFTSFSLIDLAAMTPQWGFTSPIAMEIILGDMLSYDVPEHCTSQWITVGGFQWNKKCVEDAIEHYNVLARSEGKELHECSPECPEHFEMVRQLAITHMQIADLQPLSETADAAETLGTLKSRKLGSYYRRPSWLSQGDML